MTPSNAELRQVLLGQHARLRQVLELARAAAQKALESGAGTGRMQMAIAVVERDLLEHLRTEEKLLEPVLLEADGWGDVRVGLLRAEHAHQRAVLAVLTGGSAAWPATRIVAGRMLAFCDDLLTDMEFEERELLSEAMLRDDLVLLDASDA